jgi:hypothetical protein
MKTHHEGGAEAMRADEYGNAQFSADAIARFPKLSTDLEEDAELLHVQMGTLAGAIRDSLATGDAEFPIAICAFLAEVLQNPRAISEIENAVALSFVEAREFRAYPAGIEVLAQMPEVVRVVLLDQEARGGAQ